MTPEKFILRKETYDLLRTMPLVVLERIGDWTRERIAEEVHKQLAENCVGVASVVTANNFSHVKVALSSGRTIVGILPIADKDGDVELRWIDPANF